MAAVVLVNIWGSTAKARDARRIADIKTLADAFHLYYIENGEFPSAPSGATIGDNTGSVDTILADYMSEVPQDPLFGTTGYYYKYYSKAVCPSRPGGRAIIFAFNMEDTSKGNGDQVCGYSADEYMIVLGPANS